MLWSSVLFDAETLFVALQEKIVHKKACQTCKFLVQVDLYKFLV